MHGNGIGKINFHDMIRFNNILFGRYYYITDIFIYCKGKHVLFASVYRKNNTGSTAAWLIEKIVIPAIKKPFKNKDIVLGPKCPVGSGT